jgi:hypothetical protein
MFSEIQMDEEGGLPEGEEHRDKLYKEQKKLLTVPHLNNNKNAV